jgi:glycosyltransferase involved in cell wall biosynthesis
LQASPFAKSQDLCGLLVMKITFVLPTVNLTGGIRVVIIYAQELARLGHSVQLIFPPPRPMPFRQKLASLLKGEGWFKKPMGSPSHLDQSMVPHRVLDRWRPVMDRDVPDGDVVVATWWETAEWVNALSPSKGAKVYFVQHHEIFYPLPSDRSRKTYRFPMHKIVVARWLQDIMRSEYGDQNVDLVPNSVDHSQFFAPPRFKQMVPTVGLMYATAPFKGVDLSIAALKKVREQFHDLRVVCFGSERPSNRFELPEGSEFYFSPPQESIRTLYNQCDVWLTASRSEGFNLPAMEAMACRTPVVATRTGWPEEAVKEGWNGALVDVDDVNGLVAGVKCVLSLPDDLWSLVSSNAFATVEKSSWPASAKLFEEALQRACQRAKRDEIAGGIS